MADRPPPAAGEPAAVREARAKAQSAIGRGDYAAAEAPLRALAALAPRHPATPFLFGVVALERRQASRAVEHFDAALALGGEGAEVHAQRARALSMLRRKGEAVAAAERAMALGWDSPLTLDTAGVVLSRANEHVRAVEAYRRAVALAPRNAAYQFNLATALKFVGDFDGAEHACEGCLGADPSFWKAWPALSQLRRQTPERNHVPRLEAMLPSADGDADALLHLHMALFKEREDLADYAGAFRHLAIGKAAKRRTLAYSIDEDRVLFEALTAAFPAPAASGKGHPSGEPIFVVGLPRSGTTLADRILSSHSQVQSAGELQNFGIALKQASGVRTPALLDVETIAAGARADFAAVGEAYVASTRPDTGRRPRFVDKMPLNFLYAGFIAHALPQAKIVCLRRHPLDACLGNFRQLFALNFPYYRYAYDLLDTGRYYVLFDHLVSHWRRVLPGRMLELSYESLVEGQEAQTRRLLDFCGLPFEPACLGFQDNPAPVATASAVQVRAPMNRSALGRWKRYEAELSELRALLADAGIEGL